MTSPKSNIILLHGRWPERINGMLIKDIPLCDSTNEGNWMGWTKRQLEERGYTVDCPMVADAWKAPYEDWVRELEKLVVNEDTILVALSAGAYVVLRWLAETGKKVKKVILIAPGSKTIITKENLEQQQRGVLPLEEEFYSLEIPSSLRKQMKEQTTIIVSSDGPAILQSVELFKEILDARVMILENLGHFSFLIKQVPEVLEEVLKSE